MIREWQRDYKEATVLSDFYIVEAWIRSEMVPMDELL
jgi:hypothetical protein